MPGLASRTARLMIHGPHPPPRPLVTSGATDRAIPVEPVARRLIGIPVVLNQGLGAGIGLVIVDGAVTVDHDNVIETAFSDAVGHLFQRNQLGCRTEGRFGLSVSQPAAVIRVTTAASGGGGSTA